MVKEKKGFAAFEDFEEPNVNTGVKTDVNTDANTGVNINPSVNFDMESDPLKKLQEENPRKELTTVMKGIYFDSEVWECIEQQSGKLGRGGKSQLVNEIVKTYFQKKGLL